MLLEDMFDSKSSSKFIDSEWMLFKRETQEPSITLSFLFWTVDRLLNVMKRSTISPHSQFLFPKPFFTCTPVVMVLILEVGW